MKVRYKPSYEIKFQILILQKPWLVVTKILFLAWLSFAFRRREPTFEVQAITPIPLYPYAPSYPKGVRVAEGEGVILSSISEGEGVRGDRRRRRHRRRPKGIEVRAMR